MKVPIELVVLVDPQMSVRARSSWASRLAAGTGDAVGTNRRAQQRYRLENAPLVSDHCHRFQRRWFWRRSNQILLGVPSLLQTFSGRDDFDVLAVWTLQNMGLGNIALTRQRGIDRDTLTSERALIAAQVRQEVTAAYADVKAGAAASTRPTCSSKRQFAARPKRSTGLGPAKGCRSRRSTASTCWPQRGKTPSAPS